MHRASLSAGFTADTRAPAAQPHSAWGSWSPHCTQRLLPALGTPGSCHKPRDSDRHEVASSCGMTAACPTGRAAAAAQPFPHLTAHSHSCPGLQRKGCASFFLPNTKCTVSSLKGSLRESRQENVTSQGKGPLSQLQLLCL